MTLTETGEARVRGYLFVLERSLRSFLPADVTADAVREVESHIRERLDQMEAVPDERSAVARVLDELGPPLRVAQAYSQEMTLDEAEVTGRLVPMLRALWQMAATSAAGFAWAMVAFTGWSMGLALLALAVLKPIFPGNVGFFVRDGGFRGFGANYPLPPGTEVAGGYWVIPILIVAGLAVLVGTKRLSRRMLAWMRARKPRARFSLAVTER